MEEIQRHNCFGKCCEMFCDNDEECFERLEVNGMKIVIPFCKKHAEEFSNKFWVVT